MGGRCEECPAGTYAPEATTVCETCLAGSADADQWAATPCVDCPPGTYAPDLALECTDCAAVVFDGNASLDAHAYHVWNPETESIAFGVFVATAPFVYGLFWWYGVIELPWGKRSSSSSDVTGRGRPDLEGHRDGAAPHAVEAAWGSPGFSPCPSFEGERPGYVFTTREQGLGYYPDRGVGGA